MLLSLFFGEILLGYVKWLGDLIAGLVLEDKFLLSFIIYFKESRFLSVDGRKLFGADSV